jgi:uncharacterized damage-inducible protein DinB
MYTSVAEFVEDWGRENAGSLKVMRALTDASLSQRSDPEANTLGKIAWHMVVMIGATATAAGIEVVAPQRGTEPPASASRIADSFETAARTMGEQASKKLTDGQLASEISLWGRTMTIAAAFQGLVRHLIHHRGQLTVLMREAGLIVPGVYGPSREETAAIRARQKG